MTERVEPTKRKPLTKAQKAFLLDQQGDLCGNCATPLVAALEGGAKVYGPMIDEHILPLFVGGSNDLENRAMWCVPCSSAKTKAEAAPNAKIRRIIARTDGTRRERQKIPGGGFRKSATHKRQIGTGKVIPR